jgi:hypothetical protein
MDQTPESLVNDQTAKESVNNKKVLLILLSIFVIILLSGVVYYFVRRAVPQDELWSSEPISYPNTQDGTVDPSTESTPSSGLRVTDQQDSLDQNLFYIKDNNIYKLNPFDNKSEKLTNYPKNQPTSPVYDSSGKQIPNIDINIVRVIDLNTLGFGKCEVVIGEYNCGVFTLNLKTNEVRLRKMLNSKKSLIIDLGFYNVDRFAYLSTLEGTGSSQNFWQLIIYKEGVETLLRNKEYEAYGRGGFSEDSQKLRFSKDGENLLHIATSSPFTTFDSNIHIFNYQNDSDLIIPNATHPNWLDENKVIYRGYSEEDPGYLYVYDINSKVTTKVSQVSKASTNPEVLDTNNIVFEDSLDNTIWTYDFVKGSDAKILDNAVQPFWLSENYIVYSEIEKCSASDEECGGILGDFEYGDVKLFNLKNKSSSTITEIENLFRVVSSYN